MCEGSLRGAGIPTERKRGEQKEPRSPPAVTAPRTKARGVGDAGHTTAGSSDTQRERTETHPSQIARNLNYFTLNIKKRQTFLKIGKTLDISPH